MQTPHEQIYEKIWHNQILCMVQPLLLEHVQKNLEFMTLIKSERTRKPLTSQYNAQSKDLQCYHHTVHNSDFMHDET